MKFLSLELLTLRGIATAFTAVALSATTICTSNAAIYSFGGVDNEFSTASNWDDGLVPASNSTQDINNGDTVDRSVDSTAGRTFVSGGSTLNISAGAHNDNRSGNTIRNFVGRGSQGTVNQSAGTTMQIGHLLSIGGGGVNGNGTYSQSGGALSIYRGARAANHPASPQYSLEVGSSSDGAGLYEISGGSIETRIGAIVGKTGTFSIVGSDATSIAIGGNQSLDGTWSSEEGSTLSALIDAGGVTQIDVVDNAQGAIFSQFADGSILDLGFDGIAPVPGTWTLMVSQNSDILDLGLGLSAGTDAGWSFDVDNSGTNGVLTVTYAVPEPTTVGLLALGALCLVRRRTV